ncbi:MAG TPA: hypothetical protein VNH63_08085 [Gemmatimonadales bacterium]|nr:hypothetical protein [Gemmatimonadales bacterium]
MADAALSRAATRAGLVAAAVALAGGVVAVNRLLVGVFYDDGLYAGLALALARGAGYVHPHLPGAPAAIHYPPLYPLVLAPLFGLLPLDAAALAGKVLNLLLAATGAGLIAWHAVRVELLGPVAPRWLAPTVVAAAALAMPSLAMQAVLFAEPLFVVLLVLAIASADLPPAGWSPGRAALLAGAAAALALLTRSIGVAAGAGIVVFLFVVRGASFRVLARAAAPVALAAAGWGVWLARHGAGLDAALALNYGSYGEVVRQTGLAAFGVSAPDLPRPLAAITLGWVPSLPLFLVIAGAALAILIYGLILLCRRSSAGFTLLGYLAILALWPYPPDRFLWAVLPWLALAWAAGAVALWRGRVRIAVGLVAACLAAGYATYEVRGYAHRWWEGAARDISENFTELLPWVRTLPGNAVVATDDEALVWLYSGRRAVPLYLYSYSGRNIIEPDPAAHRAYLERQGVTHVLLGSPSGDAARELHALLVAYPHWLSGVQRWPGGRWAFAVTPDVH